MSDLPASSNSLRITGFDLPGADTLGAGPVTLQGTLDARPSLEWGKQFKQLAAEFQREQGLSDVRLKGQVLVVTGPMADPRALAEHLRGLIDRTNASVVRSI